MNVSCLNERLNSAASIFLSLWFSLSGLAAVTGNAVVLYMWLFYKNESLRTISNRFLASLSVADFFVGLVMDPTFMAEYLPQSLDNHENRHVLWSHTTTATTLNLCCVAVDRFIAIRFPFRYQDILTKNRCYTAIMLVWLISLLLPFLVMLVDWKEASNHAEVWLSFSFITFVFPMCVVTLCYIYIFKVASKQCSIRKDNQNSDGHVFRAIKNFKANKTVGLVLGVCIITWKPCLVLSIVSHYYRKTVHDQCVDHKLHLVAWPWVVAIAFTSSAINPFIYYFRNGEFRQAFRRNFSWLPCLDEDNTRELALKPDRKRRSGGIGGNFAIKETKL